MVGYALGNRTGEEEDMDIILEDHPSSVRFSLALRVNVFGNSGQRDKFLVPYSVIKVAKQSRQQGAREAIIQFSDRPDNYGSLNSLFDLWGFNSFADYLYTLSELCFLEGLLPTLDASFLSPKEILHLSEVICCFKFSLLSNNDSSLSKSDFESLLNLRYKNIIWALKCRVPVSVSLVIFSHLSFPLYKNLVDSLYSDFKEFGFVNEISISVSSNDFDSQGYDLSLFNKVLSYVQEIFNSKVGISINYSNQLNAELLSNLSVSDLGSIVIADMNNMKLTQNQNNLVMLSEQLSTVDKNLIKRFPLRKEFIRDDLYSKKLGQVFDSFKYRIKKEKDKQNRLKK